MSKDEEHVVAEQRQPRKRAKLSKDAYEYVLDELVTWRLQPGDFVVEAEVARILGTSRTPVREALKALEVEGYLRVVPRAGYLVLSVTQDDIREVYQMRLLLEGGAAAMVAERIGTEGVREIIGSLEKQIVEMESQPTANGASSRATPEQDRTFHMAIAHAAGNRRLSKAISKILLDKRRLIWFPSGVGAGMLARVHQPILEAIRSGDPQKAESAMREHLKEGWSRHVQYFDTGVG